MPKYGINKAILMGNVGTEPELRHTQQGVAVCSFRLATTERRPSREGTWQDVTDWHNITLWRQKAELAKKVLHVGSGVYLEGRIMNRSWEGQDGQKRYTTEIEVDKIRLLDPPPANAGAESTPASPKTASSAVPEDDAPDDLPF